MQNKYVYLDYMATTPVDPLVITKMNQFLGMEGIFGNPASRHRYGQEALKAIDEAREQVAHCVGANANEIIWTSGATESDNLAIKGVASFYQRKGKHLITVKTEHKAVLDCFKELSRDGYEVTYLKPMANGLIHLDDLAKAIRPDTILVSVMHVNNEIGVIQPIAEIARLLRDKGIVFHVDAAQSVGKVLLDVKALDVDLMSFSAHKSYGPKGIGALYVRSKPRIRLNAIIHGGGHERGLRSGTLATHQIVGMGEAFHLAASCFNDEFTRIRSLKDFFLSQLGELDGIVLNGDRDKRVPHNINLSFDGIDGESLMFALSNSLCVSAASACVSASIEPSYVLTAIGVSDRLAHSSVRFSLGRYTTKEELDKAASVVIREVQRLRKLAS